MYDDLARTQDRSFLEHLVVQWVIPTVLTSFVIHCHALSSRADAMSPTSLDYRFADCFSYREWSYPMSAFSSVVSATMHTVAAAALLFGTTRKAETKLISIDTLTALVPEPGRTTGRGAGDGSVIHIPRVEWAPNPGTIPSLSPLPQPGGLTPTFSTEWVPGSSTGKTTGYGGPPGVSVTEMAPEVLSGPLPLYPDLLRQAGVEGEVVLEARVDSTGRVRKGSVSVVFATHPGFVEPARQALMSTLFRPARVNGRAVAMLIRMPFAFSIRGGTGRAR